MKKALPYIVSLALLISNAYAQFKSHLETMVIGASISYKTMNVNGSNYFSYIDSMPFSVSELADQGTNYSQGTKNFIYSNRDPNLYGLSFDYGFRLENRRKVIRFGAGFDSYNLARYTMKYNNYVRNNQQGQSASYNGTITYSDQATLLFLRFAYIIETPPLLPPRNNLYLFAGIEPEVGMSVGRKVSVNEDYTRTDANNSIQTVKGDESVAGKDFIYLKALPTVGAEYMLKDVSSIKLALASGFGLGTFNNIRPQNNLFVPRPFETFSVSFGINHYFRN